MLEFNSVSSDCNCTPSALPSFKQTSCNSSFSLSWNNIQDKPTCFVPCAHTHETSDIINLKEFVESIATSFTENDTNSINLDLTAGILTANLKLSASPSLNYKVPLSIFSDGLIGQIPFADAGTTGILKNTDWNTFNTKLSNVLTDSLIWVGNASNVPTQVSLSLSASGGTFGLANTGILTFPNSSSTTRGLLTSSDWTTFNNKFDTPSGTTLEYIRGDGSLQNFPFIPTTAGGDLAGSYPDPTVNWINGYTTYDSRYYSTSNPSNYINFASIIGSFSVVNSPILSSDDIVIAFGKTQGQLNAKWTKPTLTNGSVLFWNSSDLAEDNATFFWNNTFKTLILGSNSITPIDEQLIIYNGVSAKALLSGVQDATLTLKSTTATARSLTFRSGTLGAQIFSSSNVPLLMSVAGGSSVGIDVDGRVNLNGGVSTNIRYVNVDSLTVNIAKNENFVLINAGVITGITGATPLTFILPQSPIDGQEVSFGVCNGTSGITLGTAEILIQGFGGTSIVINQLPELNGGLNNGISSATYKYSSSIGRWFRIN